MLREYFNDEPWVEQAECAGSSGKIFFPESYNAAIVRLAKKICSVCKVREECLEYALKHKETIGIWGGLTPKERARLRSR